MIKPPSSIPTPRWPARRTVQYLMFFIGMMFAVDAIVGENGLMASIHARQQYRALEQSLAAVRMENARLVEEARRLREDPLTIESVARRDLGLIRPGEKVFIIRDTPAAGPR